MNAGESIVVARSAGSGPPRTAAPAGAVDCHIHIFDPRWPLARPLKVGFWSTVEDELRKRSRTGVARCVIVHPSSYGSDNGALLQALAVLGDSARGVAFVPPEVSEAELDALHAQGVRGIRLFLNGGDQHPPPGLIRAHAERLAPRGWHIEFVVREQPLMAAEDLLAALPCRIVLDHFAHMRQPAGVRQPVADTVRRLLDKGHTYLKLAAVYSVSKAPAPAYDDLTPMARTLIDWAPERMLWGSDWPHTTVAAPELLPDDAQLFDQLAAWARTPEMLETILVTNPDRLYWSS